MLIYKVTNKINGKVYIGQTIHSLEHRKNGHERGARCERRTTVKFHNALLKYGYDSFYWEVLRECTTQDELDYYEDLKYEKILKQRKLFLIFLKPYAILGIVGVLYANRKPNL